LEKGWRRRRKRGLGKGRWESEGVEMIGSEEDRRRFKTVDGRMIVVGANETVRGNS
jgi:hypothetical protein